MGGEGREERKRREKEEERKRRGGVEERLFFRMEGREREGKGRKTRERMATTTYYC